MKTKHTPGPWRMDGHEYIRQLDKNCAKIYRDGYHIGTWVDWEWDGVCPNAQLIAAAPDLLEACKQLCEFWDNGTAVHAGAEIVSDARAAIAKAEG